MDSYYTEVLLEEARQPRNAQLLSEYDYKQSGVNASCGDAVVVTLKLTEQKDAIVAIGWEGEGCIMSQAAASVISDVATGMTVEQVSSLKLVDVLEALGLEEITPGRRKCILLGLSALQAALEKKEV